MAEPTLISATATTWSASTAASKSTASIIVQTGDVLVAFGAVEHGSYSGYAWPLSVSGGGLTWTLQQTYPNTDTTSDGNNCGVKIWTATASSTTSFAVTFGRSYSANVSFGGVVYVFRGSDGVGNTGATKATAGAPSLALTAAYANSAIVYGSADWNASTYTSRTHRTVNSYTPTAGNGYEKVAAGVAGTDFFVCSAYIPDAGATGSKTVGMTVPSGQQYSLFAVEVRGTAGGGGSTYDESVSESGSAADVQDRIATLAAATSETASATDAVARTIIAVVSATEAASATDAAASAATMDAAASEATTAADAPSGALTTAAAASEAATSGDEVNWGAAAHDKDQAESATAADEVGSTAAMDAAAAEAATSIDVPAAALIALAAASEVASAGDEVVSGAASYTVELSEVANASDAASAIATLIAAQSEPLSAADAVIVNLVIGAAAPEAASASDVTDWGGASYSMAIEEAASLADAVASALEALAAMQESANTGETFAAILTAGASLLEAATAAEIVASAWQTTALLTESAMATDAPDFSAGGVVSGAMEEAGSAADVITVQFIAGFVAITVAPRRKVTGGEVRAANLNAGGRPANLPGRGR